MPLFLYLFLYNTLYDVTSQRKIICAMVRKAGIVEREEERPEKNWAYEEQCV
jgi:hypothetical protein